MSDQETKPEDPQSVNWEKGVSWAGVFFTLMSNGMLIKIASLALLILTEVYESKRRARESQEKYDLSQAQFEALVQAAILKMRVGNSKENAHIQAFDDKIDKIL